ncbi:MAG: LysM peptidoglycan-binding domain-containing protein [Thermodesulfobacteriota bacterium]
MNRYNQFVVLLFTASLFLGGCNAVRQKPSGYKATSMITAPDVAAEKNRTAEEMSCQNVEKTVDAQSQSILDEALELCNASQDFWQKGDFDNAIQTLDTAYTLLLKIDESDITELMQQKEDIRFLISKRILEIYASRNSVVNGDYNAIPLTMNSEVQREIDSFTQGAEREFFINAYRRSGKYRPYIVEEFSKAGLPVELSWLPLIESGFKPNAFSKARALGLWQFIPSTGYKFGLERDGFIDERMDPEKSTEAAIKYLTALHQMFGDWSTVLAAYNSGEGRVLRTIRTQGINYLDNFWDLYKQLPCETARYVPRFLAVLHIVSDPGKYGLSGVTPDPPIPYETIPVSRQVHLQKIADALEVGQDLLVELNPELRQQTLPGVTYPLRIPIGKKEELLAAIDSLPVSSARYEPESGPAYHRVKSGESLSTIARRYKTTIQKITLANNITKKSTLKPGQLLKIPDARGRVSATTSEMAPKTARKITQHVVSRGDSLWNIAQRYGTTVSTIQRLNNLSSTALSVGQVLQLTEESKKTYRVKSGDTPFIIAQKHDMTLEQFLELNKMTKNSTIFPKQSVYVK